MNKTFFYVLGLLILQLSFFGCFNPKHTRLKIFQDQDSIHSFLMMMKFQK